MAQRLGMPNTSVRRRFPAICAEVALGRTAPAGPSELNSATVTHLRQDNARLRRDNHNLTANLESPSIRSTSFATVVSGMSEAGGRRCEHHGAGAGAFAAPLTGVLGAGAVAIMAFAGMTGAGPTLWLMVRPHSPRPTRRALLVVGRQQIRRRRRALAVDGRPPADRWRRRQPEFRT
ncbi:hypothetical protein ACPPVO_43530 [Dactylosporangium sp. McL0621]|uniref:hypothetical protein n=1 Tax=Dactylosporangium sp. McL0621 TaxID=3415678 RepID=UPI003CF3D8F6